MALVQKFDMNIVHFQWLLDCAARQMLLELEPRYMVYANPQLTAYFKCCLDQYGDHYTQPVDTDTLQQILSAMQIHPHALVSVDPEVEKIAAEVLNAFKKP